MFRLIVLLQDESGAVTGPESTGSDWVTSCQSDLAALDPPSSPLSLHPSNSLHTKLLGREVIATFLLRPPTPLCVLDTCLFLITLVHAHALMFCSAGISLHWVSV